MNTHLHFRFQHLFIYTLLLAGLMTACVPSSFTVSDRNVYSIYNPAASSIHPSCAVYHFNDTSSLLAVEINSQELLFNQANAEGVFMAQLRIHYNLYASYNSTQLLDSATMFYKINQDMSGNEVTYWMQVLCKPGQDYVLEVFISDVLKRRNTVRYLPVNRSTENTSYEYGLFAPGQNIPYTRNYFSSSEYVKVRFPSGQKPLLWVRYSTPVSALPPPPFSSAPPDSLNIKHQVTTEYIDYDSLRFEQNGIYFLQTDTTAKQGAAVFNFGTYYPKVATPDQLMEPLRYLTSTQEYALLQQKSSKKEAIDAFWLKSANNPDKARELIRIFYTRVEYANRYFTSYKEGWMTDRGMTYIVFGAPASVYKTDDTERWIYGENMSFTPIEFVFVKRKNEYTDDDYILRRNISYKSTWYIAVDAWRNGQVFSLEK